MAPRIAKGKVIVGVSGGDRPTRGFFAAYDAMTGQFAWKFYTVPGDPSKPFENDAMKKASATWAPDAWKFGGGGAVWDGMAYDPDADLFYVGTGNAEPWPEELRKSKGKDNLYVCSILAVKPDTGELKWYFQMVPGDSWDYDSVQQMILADVTIKGRTRISDHAGQQGRLLLCDRPRHRTVHFRATLFTRELGQRIKRRDRAADGECGSGLWHGPDCHRTGRHWRA